MSITISKWLCALLCLLLTGATNAGLRKPGDQFKMKVNISGIVTVTGQCTFDQGGTLLVEYNDLLYSSLTGNNTLVSTSLKKPLVGKLTCLGDSAGNPQLNLSSTNGTSVSWQGNTLLPVIIDATSKQSTSLAIKLLVDGVAQDVNTWFSVDLRKQPTLEAELVQMTDGTDFVNGSTISSLATLTMAFN